MSTPPFRSGVNSWNPGTKPQSEPMKKKVGILIEENIIRHAKHRAAKEGRPLSDVIQDALVSYLSDKVPESQKRERAYQLFCEQAMRISKNQLKEILKENGWNR